MAIIVLLGAWCFRAPLLRVVPAVLIVKWQPTSLDVVIVIDGIGAYDEAARLLHQHPAAELWLFEREPKRLQRRGILPSALVCARSACEEAGIAPERIRVQPQLVGGTRHLLDQLQTLMHEQPTQRIGLITDEWNSRWLWGQICHRMDTESRSRVMLVTLSTPGIDHNTWWHSKSGCRRVAEAGLKLAADWLVADSHEMPTMMSDAELSAAGIAP